MGRRNACIHGKCITEGLGDGSAPLNRLQIITLHMSHLTLHPKVTERACKAKGTSEMMCSFRPLQQQQAAAAAASSSKHKQQHHHQAAARIINALVMTNPTGRQLNSTAALIVIIIKGTVDAAFNLTQSFEICSCGMACCRQKTKCYVVPPL